MYDARSGCWVFRARQPLVVLLLIVNTYGCANDVGLDESSVPKLTNLAPLAASDDERTEVARLDDRAPEAAAPDQESTGSEPAGPEVVLLQGTDSYVNTRTAAGEVVADVQAGDVTLNFVNADIRQVVQRVLGEIMGLNYVIDPTVSGTITVETPRPVARESLLPLLESVLRSNGAVIVQEGDLYRVMKWENAARIPSPVWLDDQRTAGIGGYGVQVVPLQHVAAKEMAKALEPFAPEGSILQADSSRNLLVIAGTEEERGALTDAIALFDVDWIAGMSFGLFPLESVDPETLVEELQFIFGEGLDTPIEGLIRFAPVKRINAVLVIASRSNYLRQAAQWIEKLDQSTQSGGQRLYVYNVENFRAAELAEVLNELLGNRTTSEPLPELSPELDAVSLEDDVYEEDSSNFQEEAEPLEPDPSLKGGVADGQFPLASEDEVRVIALDASNSLVILATPRDYKLIEQALEQLDVTPLQVLIEATIAEVTLNDNLRYGVQWFFDSGRSEFSLSEVATGAASQTFPGFSYLFRPVTDVRTVLNALSEVTNVNVISSPQLMVLDNQSAELQVGDEVPVATQSAVSVSDSNAPIVNSIEFRDTGVLLEVTPRVSRGGLVLMDISQEVSSVVETTTSGIDSPTIQQRRISSTVAISSGETVTLGGLIRDYYNNSSAGVPVLSEIPILGNLFSTKTKNDQRTELLVLLTPRVVRDATEAREVTDELRGRLRAVEPLRFKLQ